MGQFRKRPVVINAIEWTGKNVLEVYTFMHGAPTIGNSQIASEKWDEYTHSREMKPWIISTLEAKNHEIAVGDWIIKGIQGEHYSCKPDIFHATYEAVD